MYRRVSVRVVGVGTGAVVVGRRSRVGLVGVVRVAVVVGVAGVSVPGVAVPRVVRHTMLVMVMVNFELRFAGRRAMGVVVGVR